MNPLIQSSIQLQNRMYSVVANYLEPRGWLNEDPRDATGYLPWYTYPCISFLRDIIDPEWRVFEYGGGYSTLYYRDRVREVVSIDHDLEWSQRVRKLDPRVQLRIVKAGDPATESMQANLQEFLDLGFTLPRTDNEQHDHHHGLANQEYAAYAGQLMLQPPGYYNVVAVDGMARSLCAYTASKYVADDGFIILDNADRYQYNDVQQYLISQGYGRIDFWGTGPLNFWEWTTSVFSRRFGIVNRQIQRPHRAGPCI